MYKYALQAGIFLVAVSFGVILFPFSSAAATHPVRIFYYRQNAAAEQDFFNHANSIDVLAPQTYALQGDGTLVGSTSPVIRAFAATHGIKIMPLVTNGSFSTHVYQTILNSVAIQNAAITALITEAKQNGYWGWQIDFEPMHATYRDRFSAFVTHAAAALHQNGLILSVAVVAQTSARPSDYPSGFWQNTAGVFDYATLAKSADFLSVMTYDDPLSHGPVTEYPWLKKVINYALTQAPAAKISLGIPLYYWLWNNRTGQRIGIGGAAKLTKIIRAHVRTATFGYSTYEQEPFVHFGHDTMWYENARSIAAKIALIQQRGLYGFSAWRLGLEPAAMYSAL